MSGLTHKPSLVGRGIVVTRPAHQAGPLADMIRASGGNPILFPTLDIVDVENADPLDRLIDRLDEFDFAIFVSPNAVRRGMARITARRSLPARIKIVTVGRGSSKELERFGVTDVIVPQNGSDSEALLALPELNDVAGRWVVIFRGEGGRELLGETLSARGARVEYATCYRRVKPELDPSPLMEAWAGGKLHAVIVTSSEGMRNLFEMVGESGQDLLQSTPMLVPHARVAATARDLGSKLVIVGNFGDEQLVAQLAQYFGSTIGT